MPESVTISFQATRITYDEARLFMNGVLETPKDGFLSSSLSMSLAEYTNLMRCAVMVLVTHHPFAYLGPKDVHQHLKERLRNPLRIGNILKHDNASCTFNDSGSLMAPHPLLREPILSKLLSIPAIQSRRGLVPFD